MKLLDVRDSGYVVFHELMNGYYRDGEDSETPQEEIDAFISYLFELCGDGRISGCIAWENVPVGFVLWNVDSEDGVFSRKPGYGTILEIGVCPEARGRGIGRILSDFAQSQMGTDRFYVCAYGPAEKFWEKCGYHFSGELAENGLKIMTKGDLNGR